MPSTPSRTCELPTDGLNGCPPGVGSCFVCPHFREDGRTRREEQRQEERVHERARIVDALSEAGRAGLTAERLARRLGLREPLVRVRLGELFGEGVVSRRRFRRRTAAGGWAAVYVSPWGRS